MLSQVIRGASPPMPFVGGLSEDARSFSAVDAEVEPVTPPYEVPQVLVFPCMEDVPLEQSYDNTLQRAFDQ